MSRSPEYRCWSNMIQRCYNKDHPEYLRYGDRGIRVCDSWKQSFAEFLSDMGNRPSNRHSLDRINNHGNYEKGNCHWTVTKNQARNRRTNRWITYNGETLVLKDWADRIGIASPNLAMRLDKGWPLELALTAPARTKYTSNRKAQEPRATKLTLDGVTRTVPEWSEFLKVSPTTIKTRLKQGLPLHEVLSSDSRRKIGYKKRKNTRLITSNEQTKSLSEWARLLEMTTSSLAYKLRKGWTIENLLSQKSR